MEWIVPTISPDHEGIIIFNTTKVYGQADFGRRIIDPMSLISMKNLQTFVPHPLLTNIGYVLQSHLSSTDPDADDTTPTHWSQEMGMERHLTLMVINLKINTSLTSRPRILIQFVYKQKTLMV